MLTELQKKDKKYVWHPFTQMMTDPDAIGIVRAKDAVLYTEDGREFIDCNSSWWVNVHGHGNERIAAAIADQVRELDHVIFAGATHAKAVELAERVIHLLKAPLSKVFFSDNGSTAVEVAIKMVVQYWYNKGLKKHRILAMEGAYHGDTFGAMSVGERDHFNRPFEHMFFDVDYLSFPSSEDEAELLGRAGSMFQKGEYAALILEPLIQGSAGMRMYSVDFLDRLVKIARAHGVLVIFDEVMTGWGRTGELFAMDHCNSVPDILCLSKGLTGGVLPLGLTVATDEIYQAFLSEERVKAFLHGHSFTGNPIACAAACASLDVFEEPATGTKIRKITERHQRFVEEVAEHTMVRNARSFGTILAIDVKPAASEGYFSEVRDKAYDFFLERGLFCRPLGNVIFLNPPYCITDRQLDQCYTVFRELLDELVG